MENETAANPTSESATSFETEVVNLDSAAQGEANTQAGGNGNATEFDLSGIEGLDTPSDTPSEPVFVDVEVDGKTFKVQEDGKDYVLRDADYRRKTMDLAEQRKAVEAKAQSLQLDEVAIEAVAELRRIDVQIGQFNDVDWDAWYAQDQAQGTNDASRAWTQFQQLNARKSQIDSGLTSYQRQRNEQESQEFNGLREKCLTKAAEIIPNFANGYRDKLEALAIEAGASKDDVSQLVEPWGYQILHWAHIGKQVHEGQRKAKQMATAGLAQPAPQIGGNAKAGAADPSTMSMDEYAEARSAGRI